VGIFCKFIWSSIEGLMRLVIRKVISSTQLFRVTWVVCSWRMPIIGHLVVFPVGPTHSGLQTFPLTLKCHHQMALVQTGHHFLVLPALRFKAGIWGKFSKTENLGHIKACRKYETVNILCWNNVHYTGDRWHRCCYGIAVMLETQFN
jgi:hypothetical protein